MRSVKVPPTSTPSRFMWSLPRRRLCWSRLRSWTDQDLPEVGARLEGAVRVLDVVQGVRGRHQRREQPARGEPQHLLELLAGVDEGADDRLLPAEERDDVERDDLAGVGA